MPSLCLYLKTLWHYCTLVPHQIIQPGIDCNLVLAKSALKMHYLKNSLMGVLTSHSLRYSKLYHYNKLYHQRNVPGPHDPAGHRHLRDELCCDFIYSAFIDSLCEKNPFKWFLCLLKNCDRSPFPLYYPMTLI
jgi:hypothetical protein